MRFIPRSEAERILASGGRELVRAYRQLLKKLERIIVRDYAGRSVTMSILERELETAFAMRERIMRDKIPRAAAQEYTDTLYKARRKLMSYTGNKGRAALELGDVGDQMTRRMDATGYVQRAVNKQGALELERLGKVLADAHDFSDVRAALGKSMRDSTRIVYTRGRQLVNDAHKISLESTHAEDMFRFYGVDPAQYVSVWGYGSAPRNEPRYHHQDLDGVAPDENGLWWSSETGASTDAPLNWTDDLENYGCMCDTPDEVFADEVTRVSTAAGILTIPRGSYLLYINA